MTERSQHTFDCAPTMSDREVLAFCRDGYLMLEGVVPADVNDKVMLYCDEHGGEAPVDETWYLDGVTLNPVLAGIVRSLLGRDFTYFSWSASHRNIGPNVAQAWHRDGGGVYGPKLDCLQVFYLPQTTTMEMGPTEVLPGSHLLFQLNQYMSHYGEIRGGVPTTAPAGSIFVTVYGIWHRRMSSTSPAVRNLLKFWYVRTAEPTRDWVVDPNFTVRDSLEALDVPTFGRERHRATRDVAELFYWLAGEHRIFEEEVLRANLPTYLGPGRTGTVVAATGRARNLDGAPR